MSHKLALVVPRRPAIDDADGCKDAVGSESTGEVESPCPRELALWQEAMVRLGGQGCPFPDLDSM